MSKSRRATKQQLKSGRNRRKKRKNAKKKQDRTVRAIVYIDGFNLYYGMRDKGWRRFYWLDLRKFAINLLPSSVSVSAVHYFTARIDGGVPTESDKKRASQNASRRRQFDYLLAVETLPITNVIEGKFLRKPQRCRECSKTAMVPEEKMSDVNIATQLLTDAFHNRFDLAVIVSGDSDLSAPIRVVREEFRDKQVIVASPPLRKSKELTRVASNTIDVFRTTLSRSQLPDTVQLGKSSVTRPDEWR